MRLLAEGGGKPQRCRSRSQRSSSLFLRRLSPCLMSPVSCLLSPLRDRAPFVLTSDMAYVINGGERPTSRFQLFVDLCCQAYNLLRKHCGLFLNLLSLVRKPV